MIGTWYIFVFFWGKLLNNLCRIKPYFLEDTPFPENIFFKHNLAFIQYFPWQLASSQTPQWSVQAKKICCIGLSRSLHIRVLKISFQAPEYTFPEIIFFKFNIVFIQHFPWQRFSCKKMMLWVIYNLIIKI